VEWSTGHISISFLNGSEEQRNWVLEAAREWEAGTGLRFRLNEDGTGAVRVDLSPTGWYESEIGRRALDRSLGEPTMSLGFPDPSVWTEEYRATALHEFGHAIGLAHEHQSPASTLKWNREAVLAFYAERNRDEEWVKHNIFDRFPEGSVCHTALDAHSIMMYAFPPEFTTNGDSMPWNAKLSDADRAMAARVYPAA